MVWAVAILSSLILITYLVYPIFVLTLSGFTRERPNQVSHHQISRVFLIMSAHNEADVIQDKLAAVVQSDLDNIELICFIGADNCTDKTVERIHSFEDKLKIHLVEFKDRTGKPTVVNNLVEAIKDAYTISDNDAFLLTDANVVFHWEFIKEIASSFIHENIGIADGMIMNAAHDTATGQSEKTYMAIETKIKFAEGNLWRCAMGPFGGAYMIRAKLYSVVPDNFLVDDFFIAFNILKKGYGAIVNKKAICYEKVADNFAEEFRRKQRISAGNFQNMGYFFPGFLAIGKKWNAIFILHKLLRWLSPVFVIAIIILLTLKATASFTAAIGLLIMISLLVGLPIINYLLNQLNLNFRPLEGVTYLILMNVALLGGLLKFLKGIKTNVWQPTKRSV